MKRLIALWLLLAAGTALAADVVPVPGTRVGLVPPEGFRKAERFAGFLKKKPNASIMVNEIPGPFTDVAARLSANGLKTHDMVLLGKESLAIGGFPGLLLHLSQNVYGVRHLKWIAVFGDERHTTMITATFPADSEQALSEPLRSAVADARVLSEPPADEDTAGLTFKIDAPAGLKIARRVGNTLILTPDGGLPDPDSTDPLLVVGASATQGMFIQNKRDFATARVLSITSLKEIHILQMTPAAFPGFDGFEILAQGVDRKTGERMLVCQTMLFEKKDYYLMQGLARSREKEVYLPLFRETMRSFKKLRP
jgi:hypothetical protein